MKLRLFLFILLFSFALAREKAQTFTIGKSTISSRLSSQKADTEAFVSWRLLQNIIEERVLAELGKGSAEAMNLKVECQANQVILKGNKGPIDFTIHVNGEFFQYKDTKPKDKNKVLVDFTLQVGDRDESFFESLLAVVTLPVGMIFESLVNVVFTSMSMKAGVKDYLDVDVKGHLSPGAFVSRFATTIANLFRSSGNKVSPVHSGVVEITINEKAVQILDKIRHVEIGGVQDGLLVRFCNAEEDM